MVGFDFEISEIIFWVFENGIIMDLNCLRGKLIDTATLASYNMRRFKVLLY